MDKRTKKPKTPTVVPDPLHDQTNHATACEWLRGQVKRGQNDSGLPTQFARWVSEQWTVEYNEPKLAAFFLRCCGTTRIRATLHNDSFFFEFAPETKKETP